MTNAASLLGYDPVPVTSGIAPSNIEQWKADVVTTMGTALSTGNQSMWSGFATAFSQAVWDQIGLSRITDFNSSGEGLTSISPQTQHMLYQAADYLAQNWGSLPALPPGISNPTGLGAAPTAYDPTDRQLIASATQAEAGREFTAEQNAMDRAHALAIEQMVQAGLDRRHAQTLANQMSIAQLQEAGANTRNAARIAADIEIANLQAETTRYGIDVGAAVDREAIASREGIAAADRASRETIAREDRAESARQFDLGLAEDRRQFNSEMMVRLFERGVDLAANPVDWIAHQYWLENVGIVANYFTLESSAAQFGALPPTGPSAAGPVVGGPAIMDGDTELAQQLNIPDPGPRTVQEAVTAKPGGPAGSAMGLNAADTVQEMGGAQQVDADLAQARTTELPQQLSPDSPFLQQVQAASPQSAFDSLERLVSQIPQQGDAPQLPSLPTGEQQGGTFPGEISPEDQAYLESLASAAMAKDGGQPRALTPEELAMTPEWQQAPSGERGGVQNVAGGENAPTGGIYTGNEAGTSASTPTPGANQQGLPQGSNQSNEQLLAMLAKNLGMPIEQIRAIFPVHLLTPQYSADVINNSPVIQSLRNNTPLSSFNKGPREGAFTNIRATGTPLGLRGGQDYSASNFLTALPSTQGQIEGAIKAAGQYWPDFKEQMFRTSPITNSPTGVSGRRRF